MVKHDLLQRNTETEGHKNDWADQQKRKKLTARNNNNVRPCMLYVIVINLDYEMNELHSTMRNK